MTEAMQNALAKRDEYLKKVDALVAEDKMGTDESAKVLADAAKAQKVVDELELAESLKKADAVENLAKTPTKADGFKTVVNAIKTGRYVNALGDPLKTGGLNGEDYLLPEDVKLAINLAKKEWKSAKELVTVESTFALTGSTNYGKDPTQGLIKFEDGDEVDSSVLPEFSQKKFAIEWYGAIIPVSQILTGAEQAGLMNFLNIWFVRRSIITENTEIFNAFKAAYNSGTPKSLADETALRTSINTDLDPVFVNSDNMVIVTNQTGYNYLDTLKDGGEAYVLQPDITNPSAKTYKGHRVIVFSDSQLPNIDGTHAPVIYGNTKEAMRMMVYEDYFFDTDNGKGLGFAKNQILLKVIEGFDVVPADTSAYIYGSLTIA